MSQKYLSVRGAREHNLKNIDVQIPKESFTVVTGLSGSGKSSLAFDTIYAEGQRRYVESLSTYARQFLQMGTKPDCDGIEGLSPAIAIDQKTISHNPRSTVGTVTEIYDYLRLLFSKIGVPHCPQCGKPVERQTVSQMVDSIGRMEDGSRLLILAPLVVQKKGEHLSVLSQIKEDGFVRLRIDGEMKTIAEDIVLDKNKKHSIDIVVDRFVVRHDEEGGLSDDDRKRLFDSLELALKHGESVCHIVDADTGAEKMYSEKFACLACDISLSELSPRSFSFNSPQGACGECMGLGVKKEADPGLMIPNTRLSIDEWAIAPFVYGNTIWYLDQLAKVVSSYGESLSQPWQKLSKKTQEAIISWEPDKEDGFVWLKDLLMEKYAQTESVQVKAHIENYMKEKICPSCNGARLSKESLAVQVAGRSILDFTSLSIKEVIALVEDLKLEGNDAVIAKSILREITNRLQFLSRVGLSYLTLDRSAATLSGGEGQRIRLATQIGSQLSGVLYVLDEPSIGLHQRDNTALIQTLKQLRDLGNTVLVVEHDQETMLESDYILDIGPKAGVHGGELIASGSPKELMKDTNSITGQFLSGEREIALPVKRRKGNGKKIEMKGVDFRNLQSVDVDIPLGCMVGVSGVSGSGKSSLINGVLVKHLTQKLNRAKKSAEGFKSIDGVEHLDKIISIDQSPIGRTPRSNAATYTGVFSDIRNVFASMPEAKIRGYKEGRFSFNVKWGRCEACRGEGVQKIEMHFLPDIYVACESCKGKRYNQEALEIKYRGKSISDVLDMTIDEAVEFFAAQPAIHRKIQTLQSVGLGYIKLGQSATTFSGGEAQRIKLSTELARRGTGNTIYVLDEPTTGLHFEDVEKLLFVLQAFVDKGNTVLFIEHNLDMIKSADYVIDVGPEGGNGGGTIVATGTPEEISEVKESYTGNYLKSMVFKK